MGWWDSVSSWAWVIVFSDFWEAETRRRVVQRAAQAIRRQQPDATIWYVGSWGVQFYADEEGMKQVIPAPPPQPAFMMAQPQADVPESLKPSTLRAGDWLN